MARRKITLSDVAARAGVSRTTASYILNGRSAQMRISPATEGRVREAMAALGYRPNRSARNLRTATTKTLGVISDFVVSGNYASLMLRGAGAAARESNYLLVMGETEGDSETESMLVEEMLDRQVDGIVYVRLGTMEVDVPPLLRQHRLVLLNCLDGAGAFPAFVPDELDGGRTAAEALVVAGVADSVYIVGEESTPGVITGRLRVEGIRARLAEAGLEVAGVVPCDWSVGAAFDAVHRWLMGGLRPSAMVCLNDRIAMGVYEALAAHGLDVPREVSVVSFDGSELAQWLRPAVHSVSLPYAELGARAVRALTDPDSAPAGVVRLPMPMARGRSIAERSRVAVTSSTGRASPATGAGR